jgi:hypothetical protein
MPNCRYPFCLGAGFCCANQQRAAKKPWPPNGQVLECSQLSHFDVMRDEMNVLFGDLDY